MQHRTLHPQKRSEVTAVHENPWTPLNTATTCIGNNHKTCTGHIYAHAYGKSKLHFSMYQYINVQKNKMKNTHCTFDTMYTLKYELYLIVLIQ